MEIRSVLSRRDQNCAQHRFLVSADSEDSPHIAPSTLLIKVGDDIRFGLSAAPFAAPCLPS